MCAPALVCTSEGVVESMNGYAADSLGTTATTAAGEPISEFLFAPDEMLSEFLNRTKKNNHACSKGYVYKAAGNSRKTAMTCHAQRLTGLKASENILLILTDVEFDDHSDKPASDCSFHGKTFAPACCNDFVDERNTHSLGFNGSNALSNVALGLVHEVNQPLTAVAAYAHSCRRWISAAPTVHPKLLPTVDKIIEQVHITGQMINSLKGLVRGHDDERRVYDLNELVRESLELLALDPGFRSCAVETQLEAGPCPVLVSPVQIKIVLLNLLRNGLEASLAFDASESRLSVSVKFEQDNWASATINDSGAGVSAEAEEQLFQPFETSKSNGLGLGLIISRCLASVHGGQIEYQAGEPFGASFHLRLPSAEVSQL